MQQQSQNPEFDFIVASLREYTATMAPTVQQAYSQVASQAVSRVATQLAELHAIKTKVPDPVKGE